MTTTQSQAWGHGIATISTDTHTVLDTWFPQPHLGAPPANFDPHLIPRDLANLEGADESRGIIRSGVTTVIELDNPPLSTSDAYLRLHLLSHLSRCPQFWNLEGIFGLLQLSRSPLGGQFPLSFMRSSGRPDDIGSDNNELGSFPSAPQLRHAVARPNRGCFEGSAGSTPCPRNDSHA